MQSSHSFALVQVQSINYINLHCNEDILIVLLNSSIETDMHYKFTVFLEQKLASITLIWSHSTVAPVMMNFFGMLIMGRCMKIELEIYELILMAILMCQMKLFYRKK